MTMDRRSFLGRCAAALAVVAGLPQLVRAVESQAPRWGQTVHIPPGHYPVLYGDGVHSDVAAFDALLSGKPVWHAAKRRIHNPFTDGLTL